MGTINDIGRWIEERNRKLGPAIERFTSSLFVLLLISFIWGLFEGIFFFIVPDVLVMYIAMYNIKKGIYSLVSTIVGSLVSAVIMFHLAARYAINGFLVKIPLIDQTMIDTVGGRISGNAPERVLMVLCPFKIGKNTSGDDIRDSHRDNPQENYQREADADLDPVFYGMDIILCVLFVNCMRYQSLSIQI
jgi:hypothetical protein